jgi:lysophospholipase L1-like esterase
MQRDPWASLESHRRAFLLGSAGLSAGGLAAISSATTAAAESSSTTSLIQPGDTILFQGDSITDKGRKRELTDKANNQEAFGDGYAWMAASQMVVSKPDYKLQCFNRGISGNKAYQLAERWQTDCLDLKPNVLSILIGVNDIWHKLNGNYDGTVEVYEKDFLALLERTKAALPEIKLVVCEPFVLKCGAVNDKWFPEFDSYRAAAKRIAEQTGAAFVPFQTMFDRAVEIAPPENWAADGVHPTATGHALMAHIWQQAVGAC